MTDQPKRKPRNRTKDQQRRHLASAIRSLLFSALIVKRGVTMQKHGFKLPVILSDGSTHPLRIAVGLVEKPGGGYRGDVRVRVHRADKLWSRDLPTYTIDLDTSNGALLLTRWTVASDEVQERLLGQRWRSSMVRPLLSTSREVDLATLPGMLLSALRDDVEDRASCDRRWSQYVARVHTLPCKRARCLRDVEVKRRKLDSEVRNSRALPDDEVARHLIVSRERPPWHPAS